MSFFKTVGGRVDIDNLAEMKVLADGTVVVSATDDRIETKLDNAIVSGDSYMVTDHVEADNKGFYVVYVTVPDDVTTLFFIDWSFATQQEGTINLFEGATVVGIPNALVIENRNRNSANTTAVSAERLGYVSGSEPAVGGTSIYQHYFPRDMPARHPDGGRLILQNDTIYAFKFDASNTKDNEISVRIDLVEIAA